MQFIVLAVYMPEQEPQPGQAQSSSSLSCRPVIFPDLTAPTPSKTVMRSTGLPRSFPASMGPPLMTMAGMLSRRAAMSIPGMILSQLGIRTRPSKG